MPHLQANPPLSLPALTPSPCPLCPCKPSHAPLCLAPLPSPGPGDARERRASGHFTRRNVSFHRFGFASFLVLASSPFFPRPCLVSLFPSSLLRLLLSSHLVSPFHASPPPVLVFASFSFLVPRLASFLFTHCLASVSLYPLVSPPFSPHLASPSFSSHLASPSFSSHLASPSFTSHLASPPSTLLDSPPSVLAPCLASMSTCLTRSFPRSLSRHRASPVLASSFILTPLCSSIWSVLFASPSCFIEPCLLPSLPCLSSPDLPSLLRSLPRLALLCLGISLVFLIPRSLPFLINLFILFLVLFLRLCFASLCLSLVSFPRFLPRFLVSLPLTSPPSPLVLPPCCGLVFLFTSLLASSPRLLTPCLVFCPQPCFTSLCLRFAFSLPIYCLNLSPPHFASSSCLHLFPVIIIFFLVLVFLAAFLY
ncbi:hypothetical protein C7M84_004149 [Penaeus vannamei]|uniref:Uncharacterized protein n=1 Tax=Penaeus vannamei TaxID=6689 RepID=A0A423TL91_PENVA|nr:hypothetical protein C7M84_004149 [Penaeus vannamei]